MKNENLVVWIKKVDGFMFKVLTDNVKFVKVMFIGVAKHLLPIAMNYDHVKRGISGVAKVCPNDKFDLASGLKLALKRCQEKVMKHWNHGWTYTQKQHDRKVNIFNQLNSTKLIKKEKENGDSKK